ncbi:hypothetical protein H0H87_005361 [Tephrocybe sp. NHM501043]|nr:hypothetical protein H0H87_005361 [Tephrocybe sp. NHM501043]
MPSPLHKPPAIKCNVYTDLKATFHCETATTKRIALIPHPHKFVSAIGAFTTHALNAEGPAAIACFMAGIDLTFTDDAIFTHLADVPPSFWLPQQPSVHCRLFPYPVQPCLQELVHPG